MSTSPSLHDFLHAPTAVRHQHTSFGDPSIIRVLLYTDPLCPWSWAFEPIWRKLCLEFGDRIRTRTVLTGMIVDWSTYVDPLHSIRRPAQMVELTREASRRSHMPVDPRIWCEDPPHSSYPACLAVKAADAQQAGLLYLRRLREALFVGRRNIARVEVLLEVAAELNAERAGGPPLDLERLRVDMSGPAARAAFVHDLLETRYHDIARFPSVGLSLPGRPIALFSGYQSYETIRDAVAQRVPRGFRPRPIAGDPLMTYMRGVRRATVAEVAQALDLSLDQACSVLEHAVNRGRLAPTAAIPGGYRLVGPAGS